VVEVGATLIDVQTVAQTATVNKTAHHKPADQRAALSGFRIADADGAGGRRARRGQIPVCRQRAIYSNIMLDGAH
jgi:hypothetical protein